MDRDHCSELFIRVVLIQIYRDIWDKAIPPKMSMKELSGKQMVDICYNVESVSSRFCCFSVITLQITF